MFYMGSGNPSLLTSQQAIYPPRCLLALAVFLDRGHAECLTGATEACEGALFLVPEEHSYLVMCLSLHNPTVKHSVTSLTSPFSLSQSTE